MRLNTTRWDDDSIRTHAHDLIRAYGPNEAAVQMGVARDTVLSLAAGAPVRPSTMVAIRRRLYARDAGGA